MTRWYNVWLVGKRCDQVVTVTYLKDILDVRPGRRVAAGHQGGAVAGALLPAAHARAHVEQALLLEGGAPPRGVLCVRRFGVTFRSGFVG